MYRRPKFLERLIEIRLEMAAEVDYDIDLYAELARSGSYQQRPRREIGDTSPLREQLRPAELNRRPRKS